MADRKSKKGGVGRNRHTKSVSDFRQRVKLFEREFTDEVSRAKKSRTADEFNRWAARKMARLAALAASVAQRKRAA